MKVLPKVYVCHPGAGHQQISEIITLGRLKGRHPEFSPDFDASYTMRRLLSPLGTEK